MLELKNLEKLKEMAKNLKEEAVYKKYDIVYVDFGEDGLGSEQHGKRPAVVLSNNVNNQHAPTIIVAPISSKVRRLPVHVYITLAKESMIMLEQIRVISKERIIETTEYTLTDKEKEILDKRLLDVFAL